MVLAVLYGWLQAMQGLRAAGLASINPRYQLGGGFGWQHEGCSFTSLVGELLKKEDLNEDETSWV